MDVRKLSHTVTDELCRKHNIYVWEMIQPVTVYKYDKEKKEMVPDCVKKIRVCPRCGQEAIDKSSEALDMKSTLQHDLSKTYDVFYNKSIIPSDLKDANYSTFTTSTQMDNHARNFGLRQNDFWFRQQGTGNALLSGHAGVGKSHLTLAIAKKLNDDFRANGEPKSVLYIPIQQLFRKIKDGFDDKTNHEGKKLMELMKSVDFLFVDDLGKEATYQNEVRRVSDFKQEILYELFDARSNSFINTNLSKDGLQKAYDKAVLSRMLKGAKGHTLFYPDTAEDKRVLPF
ncbi:ATP-binding protein [Streptococcus sp. 20-1249]|uniref:ATP-binding protein n=1 Tax=Streptococcus hepaticus TaxID=3349163 RepID=UPI003747B246